MPIRCADSLTDAVAYLVQAFDEGVIAFDADQRRWRVDEVPTRMEFNALLL